MPELSMYIGIFVLALAVLLKASDWFINAAEKIGLSLGVSPFIIGVTIVAFGTSLPELATSIASVFSGNSEIVVGNVVGSNITNIALVLGLTALYARKIKLESNIWSIDLPYLLGSAFLMYFMLSDMKYTIFEAMLSLFGIVIFLTYSFKSGKDQEAIRPRIRKRDILMLVVGGIFVYFSADYTIFAIEKISAFAGINPEVIALTGVALGTSLPEVIVSLGAARKGKTAIAVGNVLGSNIFNTYAVMGIPRLFGDLSITQNTIDFSLPFMIVMTFLFGVMCISSSITRWEGWVLLMFYLFFFVQLFSNI